MTKILLVEDEQDLRFSLVHNLEFEGYDVTEAANGPDGWDAAEDGDFDLIILDIMMPGIDGLTLLKKIRGVNTNVPIMMLTAKSTEMDKVIGFEMGADDYLTKPFGLGEFLARVKALLRRNRAEQAGKTSVRFQDIEVDFDNFTIKKADEEIHFSQKEFLLLKYLIQRPKQAIEKGEVLGAVWGYRSDATTRTIDTHIARIRRKLGDQNTNRIIQTVPTVGYKFVADLEN
ncbi:MAG: response regulator transcription factor [Acidobacteriota bacterium]|nr:response regulator transcription factor [Acidobacteriota bacterium]